MKAGKLDVEQINFLGYTFSSVDQQRLKEIEDEFEYELGSVEDDADEEEEDFIFYDEDEEEL